MEDAIKEQSSGPGNIARPKLRYPLRSATKTKNDNSGLTTAEISNSTVSKRGKPASKLSKSVSVLDHSVKDKSAKSTRRLSVPSKSTAGPFPRSTGIITPISETRTKRSSGCEPLQRMRDELKSYGHRHNLSELGEPVKELLKSYNFLEDLEQLQVSESCSLVPKEGTESYGEIPSSSVATSTVTKKLRSKSLNTGSTQASSVAESAKNEDARKNSTNGNQASVNRSSTKLKSGADKGAYNPQKKSQRPSKREINKEKAKTKNEGNKSLDEKDLVDSLPAEKTQQEGKENLDAQQMEQISSTQ